MNNKLDIVLASNNFGTLIECDTEIKLRAATREEYERTVTSWDAGSFGIIGVEIDGSLRRCHVSRPLTSAELDQARALVEPSRVRYERNTERQRARNMAGMGA